MQPHMTMGFLRTPEEASSARASVVSTPSSVAEARKEQVLISATSQEATSSASSRPASRSSERMRSVSTSFLAQPSVTK